MALQLNSTTSDSLDQTPSQTPTPTSNAETEQTRRILQFDPETAHSARGSDPRKIAATRPTPPPRSADVSAEIAEVKATFQTQLGDLSAQVNALTQQLATLVGMVARGANSDAASSQLNPTRAPAEVPATSPQTAPDRFPADPADPAPADPAPANQASQGHYLPANRRVARYASRAPVYRPSAVMLSGHKYDKTDLGMWKACQGLKPLPSNPSTALSAFAKIKPALWREIQQIKSPGVETDISLENFLSEVSSVLSPEEHSLASILTEALTTGDKTTDATTQNLLRLAVNCGTPDKISQQTQQIAETGRYDRALSALTDVTASPTYHHFDPETNLGKQLWSEILYLLLAFWKRPKSAQADQSALEQTYRNMSCECHEDIGTYLTEEAELHLKMQSCNICLSDLERIRVILTGCSTGIRTAYSAFKQRKTEDGKWNHLRDCDVATFAKDLESVADAVQTQPLLQPDKGMRHANKTSTKQQRPVSQEAAASHLEHTDERPCWDHQYLKHGCPRGETCPWKHVGDSGAKHLRFATEDGTCRRFMTGSCDRGDQCKFAHLEQKQADAKDTKPSPSPEKKICYDHAYGTCKRGDQCNFLHPPKPKTYAAAAHFSALRPDTDDDSDE